MLRAAFVSEISRTSLILAVERLETRGSLAIHADDPIDPRDGTGGAMSQRLRRAGRKGTDDLGFL